MKSTVAPSSVRFRIKKIKWLTIWRVFLPFTTGPLASLFILILVIWTSPKVPWAIFDNGILGTFFCVSPSSQQQWFSALFIYTSKKNNNNIFPVNGTVNSYQCYFCGRSFTGLTNVKNHMREDHGQKYKSDKVIELFSSRARSDKEIHKGKENVCFFIKKRS